MVALKRCKALALALIALTVLGTSGSWHVADDPDAPALVLHDHSAHDQLFKAAFSHEAPAHCAICHWLQSFRSDSLRSDGPRFASAAGIRGGTPDLGDVRAAARLSLPSRAPPL